MSENKNTEYKFSTNAMAWMLIIGLATVAYAFYFTAPERWDQLLGSFFVGCLLGWLINRIIHLIRYRE